MTERVERVDEQDRVLGVVDREEAILRGWPHRVATTVCRDPRGRVLVHRRPEHVSRFPGHYDWLVGGAVEPGETYQEAAVRELEEELGVRVPVRFVFKFLCRGAISPYWLGVHEAVLSEAIVPDASEIAWCGWLTERELREALRGPVTMPARVARPDRTLIVKGPLRRWVFVPDGMDALRRYLGLGAPAAVMPSPAPPPP